MDWLVARHPDSRALLPHHRRGFIQINDTLVLPHVPPELFEEVLLLADELLFVHLTAEAELVARLVVAHLVAPVDIRQRRAGDLLDMGPFLLYHLAPLFKSKIFLLAQGVKSRNPSLL